MNATLTSPKTAGFTIAPAHSAEDRSAVYRLRYEAYRDPTPEFAGSGPEMSDQYDDQHNCLSYLMRSAGGTAAGSIRPCIYSAEFSWSPIPAYELFGKTLIPHLGETLPMVQSTHFVVDESCRSFQIAHKLLLFQEILRTALDHKIGHICTVVRNTESMLNFYSRIGLFPVGGPHQHPIVQREALLLVADSEQMLALCRESRVFRGMVPPKYL